VRYLKRKLRDILLIIKFSALLALKRSSKTSIGPDKPALDSTQKKWGQVYISVTGTSND
jgi:hypothetical protein